MPPKFDAQRALAKTELPEAPQSKTQEQALVRRDSGVFVRAEEATRSPEIQSALDAMSAKDRASYAKSYDTAQSQLLETQARKKEMQAELKRQQDQLKKEEELLDVVKKGNPDTQKELGLSQQRMVAQFEKVTGKPSPDDLDALIDGLKRSNDLYSKVLISQYEDAQQVWSKVNEREERVKGAQGAIQNTEQGITNLSKQEDTHAEMLRKTVTKIDAAGDFLKKREMGNAKTQIDLRPRAETIQVQAGASEFAKTQQELSKYFEVKTGKSMDDVENFNEVLEALSGPDDTTANTLVARYREQAAAVNPTNTRQLEDLGRADTILPEVPAEDIGTSRTIEMVRPIQKEEIGTSPTIEMIRPTTPATERAAPANDNSDEEEIELSAEDIIDVNEDKKPPAPPLKRAA